MTTYVAVLMGGWSAEREVSLVSGVGVVKALKEVGYRVSAIDVQRDAGALLGRLYPRPDVVFNALHGRYGEDGCVQGILEFLGIPYTHSGVLASALAMDKVRTKEVLKASGLRVAEHRLATREQIMAGDVLPRPYVIKPINEGSSVGVHVVRSGDNQPILGDDDWSFGRQVMVETFIPGRELTVAVMGDRPLAVTEIITSRDFYDYSAKYVTGGSDHTVPADLPREFSEAVMAQALRAHQALGCRGLSRVDFRWDPSDEDAQPVVLEVNTQPGLTPTSLAPEQAAHVGLSFGELCQWIVENAQCDG